ncbi:MAG: DUF885 domain-containing protein [bacterium]|nr:DUF885 domain-containing protein [bacterium]
MRRTFSTIAILLACLAILAGSDTEAAKSKQGFEQLAAEILESLQSFYSVHSTEMGIHHYDHRFTDYSSKSVKAFLKKLTSFEQKLYKYKGASLGLDQKIDYQLLKSNVDIAILDLKRIQWHKKSPQLYVDEVVNGLYFLMLSQHAPLNEKVVTVIDRMKAVPPFLSTAQENLKSPPSIYVEAAIESLESGMKFYQEVAGELMQKFPERADNILKYSTAAREAMNDFVLFLSELPKDSDSPFAIGKDNFDYKLLHEYALDFDSDSLLTIGTNLLEEASQAYSEYEAYVESQHQNGSDSVYIPNVFTKDDILNYYNWEVNQIQVFIEQNNIVTIPDDIAPVKVIETPPFLLSMVAGIAYQPAGPFDSGQTGYFYVRPIPDDLDRRQLEGRYRYVHRRGFKGSAVHESYPGHHLQMQLAGQNADPVRKWQTNLLMIEGWALYCEQMMYEAGLFGEEDPAQWLGILGGIRFRAARIVADVKLHTGQFSYQECVDWMIDVLEIDSESGKSYIRKQVRKYTLMPTMPMTYLTGKREIMRLREAAEQKLGDSFDLGEFHDELLSHGSISPALLWEPMGL